MQIQFNANSSDIIDIANEITIHSYRMGKTNMEKLFKEISPLDYEIISILEKNTNSPDGNDKFYLSDIAERMDLPISRVSRLVRMLNDRHLVTWQHDGDGNDGTYIQITEKGIGAVKAQQDKLRNFYTNVIDKFGKERFLAYLQEMIELDDIMQKEISVSEEGK